jgi:hypothetical protein
MDACLTEEERSTGGETGGTVAVVCRNVLSDRHIWHYLVAYRGTLEIPLINDNPGFTVDEPHSFSEWYRSFKGRT